MKLLRLKSVIEKVGLGRSTIYSLIKNNEFPAQIHLTQATSVWIEAEIDQWIRERVAETRPNRLPAHQQLSATQRDEY